MILSEAFGGLSGKNPVDGARCGC